MFAGWLLFAALRTALCIPSGSSCVSARVWQAAGELAIHGMQQTVKNVDAQFDGA